MITKDNREYEDPTADEAIENASKRAYIARDTPSKFVNRDFQTPISATEWLRKHSPKGLI